MGHMTRTIPPKRPDLGWGASKNQRDSATEPSSTSTTSRTVNLLRGRLWCWPEPGAGWWEREHGLLVSVGVRVLEIHAGARWHGHGPKNRKSENSKANTNGDEY